MLRSGAFTVSAEIFIRAQGERLFALREEISRRPPQIQCQGERWVTLFAWNRDDPRCMSDIAEPRQAPALRLKRVDGKLLVGESTRMSHVIGATPNRTSRPFIHHIKHKRRVHRDVGMQARWRLPGAVSHPRDEFALLISRL